MTLGDFNIDRRDDPLNRAFTSTGLRPPDALNFIPRTIFDDPDPTAAPDRRHFYRRIARAFRIFGRLRVTDIAVTNEGRWWHAICKYLGQELLRARVRAVFA